MPQCCESPPSPCRGLNYLIRYFMLIVINAYMVEEVKANFQRPFSTWLNDHPEITKLLENVQYPEKL